jgi:hypothetical protein
LSNCHTVSKKTSTTKVWGDVVLKIPIDSRFIY